MKIDMKNILVVAVLAVVVGYVIDSFITGLVFAGFGIIVIQLDQLKNQLSNQHKRVITAITYKKETSVYDFTDYYDEGDEDDLYEEAKTIVIKAKNCSTSLLQRKLRIGYGRAARLIDMLEDNGVVGPANGAKGREVFSIE